MQRGFISHHFLWLTGLLIMACATENRDKENIDATVLPDIVDYNFHVRPILSDKCFACHGPDMQNQKAGLRLDKAENAFAALENSDGYALVPKRPKKSQAYLRMISEDPSQVMPPPESNLSLTSKEIAIIEKWIRQGAEYKPHWAFVTPKARKLPKLVDGNWPKQPIDFFVKKQLESQYLQPSKEASKETLIRRVTFDLTGLPPTLDEIDAFINDQSANAYEKLVDRLLASDSYGERMAADWLDVARYADSDGYLDDKHRDFHPWRDWVINAFNRNMPYDTFISYQIAGDLLPNATKESTLATAFNRLHKKNSEAGIVFEEYRVEYVADRTNTLGKGILGLSMECARCHDHKYDPISQKEYYQLSGFFNSTFEIGTPVYGPDQVPGPALLLSTEKQDAEIDALRSYITNLEDSIAQKTTDAFLFEDWLTELKSAKALQKNIKDAITAYYPFEEIRSTKNSKEYSSPNQSNPAIKAKLIEPIHKSGKFGKALFVSDYNRVELGKHIGWYDRTDAFSFQLYIRPDTLYNEAGIMWHSEELRLGLKGYSLHLRDNKLQFIMAKTWPQNALQVTTETAIPEKEWTQVTVTYDGSSSGAGVHIYVNGVQQQLTIEFDNLYKSILFVPDIHTYGFQGITLGARDKFIPFKDGGFDEFKVYNRELSALEVMYTFDPELLDQLIKSKNNHLDEWRDYYNKIVRKDLLNNRLALRKLRADENKLLTGIPEIMVMGDLPEPRPTYVLERGAYDAHRERVEPSTPEAVLAFDAAYPKNRFGLAQWIFDDENPLTARVFVNRIWQMHFGRGIVKTSDDFGAQGSLPSHPALLDWLAVYFVESGWDIKALHKMIVTSSTYMQSSKVSQKLLEIDPENILLSRGPRYRMPAEMIRDNALAVSGLLVDKKGGTSTYPYQPDGVWDGLTTKHWAYRYLQEDGEGLYRRSIYTIWKRAAPPPFMQIFDLDDRGDCEVNRRMSSTPLQALNLLNDPQFVEASRVLAANVISSETDAKSQLQKTFRLLIGRYPDADEQAMLQSFYEEELEHFDNHPELANAYLSNGAASTDPSLPTNEVAALGVVASGIMNTTEAFTKK